MTRPAEKCPVCDGSGVVTKYQNIYDAGSPMATSVPVEKRPCPRCRPAAPGRMLKAVPDQSLGAEEIARELGEN